ncbi:hypothetical protein LSCM1_00256 [Leishmania martiniquensis]|uniref:FYVE-type domain-containing protein n=1 Tax=Leishmania martiniquensis TaxID=1580590 RepID=A0A836K8L6_9TRYP|nr:hypothetical protein LSCM1_00256 [Leishmania martiniquensis]
MGKSSASSSSSQRCAECQRGFGMTLWRHTCDVCRRTVCDDCAPRSTESVDVMGEATKLRVCKTCGTTGHRPGNAVGGNSATDSAKCTVTVRPDPNSEAERERRAHLIEERNKIQRNRGCSRRADSESGPRSALTSERHAPPAPALSPHTPASSRASVSSPAAPPPAPESSGTPATPLNPALEAAMRRQQQQQARGRAAASLTEASMSSEKARLICEIEMLLAKHREDPPFGLRASDEAKLRGYLQFIKKKYCVSE